MSSQTEDESSQVEEVTPPWGSIPAEAYILRHWNDSSPWDTSYQRKHLVLQYIKSGHHDASTLSPITPTPHQISTILQPWRTTMQRDIATNPGQIGCIWLRTDYSPETDPTHDSLVENIDLFNTLDDEDRLLNDKELYNFGDDWKQILHVMPELVVLNGNDASYRESRLSRRVEAEKELIAAKAYLAGEEDEDKIDGAPIQLIENTRAMIPAGDVEGSVLAVLRSQIHKACVVNYIIVEDKEALERGGLLSSLLLLFLDAEGKVVRWSRVGPQEVEQMAGFWLDGSWDEVNEWMEARLGDDYDVDGIYGYLLH